DLTRPSGLITTSIFTLPVTFMRLARSGYVGVTLVFILRLDSSVEPDCAKPALPHKRATAPASSATLFQIPNLIDTSPRRILDNPPSGKGMSDATLRLRKPWCGIRQICRINNRQI